MSINLPYLIRAILISIFLTGSVHAVTTGGMTGYWKFDGCTRDISGYNHHGLRENNGLSFRDGKSGQCLVLDSGVRYLEIDNHDRRLSNIHAVTVEAWIYVNTFDKPHETAFQTIYCQTGSFNLGISGDRLAIKIPGNLWAPSTAKIRINRWFHAAWTYDSGFNRLYIDGKECAAISAPGSFEPGKKIYIGHPIQGFYGFIDEVKVYNRALTPGEIESSYYETAALTAHWPLDGDTRDHSEKNRHGSRTGTVDFTGSLAGLGLSAGESRGYITVKNGPPVERLQKEATVSAWFFPHRLESRRSLSTGAPRTQLLVHIPGALSMGISGSYVASAFDGQWWSPEEAKLETGKWYHLAVTMGKKKITVWINGNKIAETDRALHPRQIKSGPAVIGRFSGKSRGIIDDIKIYCRALPAHVLEQNYRDVPQPQGIWPFDGDTRDYSGFSHHGKAINGPYYTAGKIGRCLAFDGNNDYVLLDNKDTRLDFVWIVTVEAWIKGGRYINEYQHIYDKYGGFTISVKNGRLAIGGRGGWYFPDSTVLVPGRWYHVTGTISLTEKRLYINGQLKFATPLKQFGKEGDTPYISQPHFPFNGLIDEVKIYNTALSPRDILLNYLAGRNF